MADNSMVPLKPKLIVSGSIIFFLIVIDQLTKLAAALTLRGKPGFAFLDGVLRLEYAENTGAFLSLGADLSPESRTLIFVVGVVFVIGFCVAWLVRTANNWLGIVALSLVISGGIGNLIDRIWRGSVIDFIYMGIGPLHTGVFNIADMAISGGLVMMLYDQYVNERSKQITSA